MAAGANGGPALRDFPLGEVLRRVDLIHAHSGAGTDVQETRCGGPTSNVRGAEHLQRGAGTLLRFNVLMAGHGDCNRSAVMLVAGGRAFDAFADVAFIQRAMRGPRCPRDRGHRGPRGRRGHRGRRSRRGRVMTQRALSLILMAVFVLLAGCATEAEAAWGRVLQRFVNERGEVDFQALPQDRADLDRYLRYVADIALAEAGGGMQGTQAAQLAQMVNACNALSMFNVVVSGMPATHAGFNKVTFFHLRKLAVGG